MVLTLGLYLPTLRAHPGDNEGCKVAPTGQVPQGLPSGSSYFRFLSSSVTFCLPGPRSQRVQRGWDGQRMSFGMR
jgi:hypothetical protein